jgi:phosphatidylglycerophosphatase A
MSKYQSDNLSIGGIFRKSNFSGKIALILSTWFGIGLLPVAPGTFGSVAAVPIALGLACLGIGYTAFAISIVVAVAIWSSGRCKKLLGNDDPSAVVIDEVAGLLLTMFLLAPSWLTLGLGFALFRFFDILKPYPIRKVEKLRGGLGIVVDDLVAGVYAHCGVRLILFFVK